MDNVSFGSNIKLVSNSIFKHKTSSGYKNVNYPWTIKQSVCAAKASTDRIFDCTALGITDGNQVLLLHICPTEPKNFNYKNIEKFIKDNIFKKLNPEYLQGFILGSKANNINSPNSTKLFDFLEGVLKKLNIPYSKFKGGNYENNLAYNSINDEWIIGNYLLDNVSRGVFGNVENAAKKIFDEIEIAKTDNLYW